MTLNYIVTMLLLACIESIKKSMAKNLGKYVGNGNGKK